MRAAIFFILLIILSFFEFFFLSQWVWFTLPLYLGFVFLFALLQNKVMRVNAITPALLWLFLFAGFLMDWHSFRHFGIYSLFFIAAAILYISLVRKVSSSPFLFWIWFVVCIFLLNTIAFGWANWVKSLSGVLVNIGLLLVLFYPARAIGLWLGRKNPKQLSF